MTPGTNFVGTDPVNALLPSVPGKGAPDEAEPGVVEVDEGVCADALSKLDSRDSSQQEPVP